MSSMNCRISKEDFLRADRDTRDSMVFDNLTYVCDGIDELKRSEESRDRRAMTRGSLFGLLGGFMAVLSVAGVGLLVQKLIGG